MTLRGLARACLVLTACLHSAAPCQERPSSLEELQTAIQEALDEVGYGSAGVALVSKDRTIWAAGVGIAEPGTQRQADENTYWRVGSISKSFVGLAALILEERGRLRLTDTVADLLPEVEIRNTWEDEVPVRLVHLLEHTAGLDDLRPKDYASNDPTPLSLLDGLSLIRGSLYCRWPPGLHFSYSNAGPAIAAYIVQKSAGRQFEEFIADEIFEPLRMTGASLLLTDNIEARLAAGYDGGGELVPYHHIGVRPSGALNATPVQMANFVRMLLNRGRLDGRQLVSQESIERMERSDTTLSAPLLPDQGYGIGNASWSQNGFVFRGHNGGMPGYQSWYGYLPEHGLGFCMMVSASNPTLVSGVFRLVSEYLIRNVEKPSAPTLTEMPPDIVQWTGYYRPITPRNESARYAQRLIGVCRIWRMGEGLIASLPGRDIEFHPAGDQVFKRKLRPMTTLAFVEGPDGTRYVQGEIGNLRKVSAAVVWFERIVAGLAGLLMLSSPIWAIAWAPLKLVGKLEGRPVAVRIWPLLAVMTLVTATAVIGMTLQGTSSRPLVNEVGQPSLAALSFVVLSWVYVLLSVVGLTCSLRSDPQRVGRFAHLHSIAVSSACLAAATYFLYYRAIGFPPW